MMANTADVFSVDLYTGDSSTRTITTGLDLPTSGGLVWIKERSSKSHALVDTERGVTKYLESDAETAEITDAASVTAFGATSFDLGGSAQTNSNTKNYVSWTFLNNPAFFKVLKWTGDGISGREIPHGMDRAPGMVIVKDRASSNGVYQHISKGGEKWFYLSRNNAMGDHTSYWNDTDPDDTNITLGNSSKTNGNTRTYAAWVFAHDPSSYGMIQCGEYTGDGVAGNAISLGWKPQYVFIKVTSGSGQSYVMDTTRGINDSGVDKVLLWESSTAEQTATDHITLTADGFEVQNAGVNTNSSNYIYMAIREEEETGSPLTTTEDVFSAAVWEGDGVSQNIETVPDFSTDGGLNWIANRGGAAQVLTDTVRGAGIYWRSNDYLVEITDAQSVVSFDDEGYNLGTSAAVNTNGDDYVGWSFKNHPDFFNAQAYTGNVTNRVIPHGLNFAPGLVITKNLANGYALYQHRAMTGNNWISFVTTANKGDSSVVWNGTLADETNVSIGTSSQCNANTQPYMMYSFAHNPDLIHCGSYTGTGASGNEIDLGWEPSYITIQKFSSGDRPYTFDTARGIDNSGNDAVGRWDSTSAETSADLISLTSDGFEPAATSAINTTSAEYLFVAVRGAGGAGGGGLVGAL